MKAQYIVRRQPIALQYLKSRSFRQMGGLNRISQVFSEETIKSALEELNQKVFVYKIDKM